LPIKRRDAFLYEKAFKTDIYAGRFALITVFSFKNEKFSSTLRAFYKNAWIFTPVRLAFTLYFDLICFKIIAPLNLLAEK
jgi:hypothetical protein